MDNTNNPSQNSDTESSMITPDQPTTVTSNEVPITPPIISAGESSNPTETPDPLPVLGTPTTLQPPKDRKKITVLPLVAAVFVLAIIGAGAGGYFLGSSKNKASKLSDQSQATAVGEKPLTIPQNATVIAQCAKGRGTQYALPKDIPLGPVYNVYEGKVIGIEFMVGKDELLGAAKNFLNLPLYNTKFDHVNIGLLSQGHAGFPTPHYHVDIMMVPVSITDKITCT